jgi:hypothetical protein
MIGANVISGGIEGGVGTIAEGAIEVGTSKLGEVLGQGAGEAAGQGVEKGVEEGAKATVEEGAEETAKGPLDQLLDKVKEELDPEKLAGEVRKRSEQAVEGEINAGEREAKIREGEAKKMGQVVSERESDAGRVDARRAGDRALETEVHNLRLEVARSSVGFAV